MLLFRYCSLCVNFRSQQKMFNVFEDFKNNFMIITVLILVYIVLFQTRHNIFKQKSFWQSYIYDSRKSISGFSFHFLLFGIDNKRMFFIILLKLKKSAGTGALFMMDGRYSALCTLISPLRNKSQYVQVHSHFFGS